MSQGEGTITTESKPKKFWDGALKMVKGENSTQLIEAFTSEMTLVAEGLCEDQSQLHRDVDRMMAEEDRRVQKLESRISSLESETGEERDARDREMEELKNRVKTLEKQVQDSRKEKDPKKKSGTIIRDLTWLVGIAGGAWIIVTILNLIKG